MCLILQPWEQHFAAIDAMRGTCALPPSTVNVIQPVDSSEEEEDSQSLIAGWTPQLKRIRVSGGILYYANIYSVHHNTLIFSNKSQHNSSQLL